MYSIILTVHISAFIINITAVVMADIAALLWASSVVARLPRRLMKALHYLVYIGLGVSIISGATMAYPLFSYLITEPIFQVKLAAVGALVINSFIIGRHIHLPVIYTFKELSWSDRRTLFLSGAISLGAWATVALCGFLLPL